MPTFRQANLPGDRANWIEYHYNGHVRVRNGVTEEVTNREVIEILLSRGYEQVPETEDVEEQVEETKPTRSRKNG